jgi:hypothetical protein
MVNEMGFPRPKNPEWSKGELEKLLAISVNPLESKGDFVSRVVNGLWARFIVTEDFKIVLGTRMHATMADAIGTTRDECIIEGGTLNMDTASHKLSFDYSYVDSKKHQRVLNKAVENKIREFLRSENIDFN